MKSKMNKDLSITLKAENNLEKHILELNEMITTDSASVKKLIEKMEISEALFCKNILQFLTSMFSDKIGKLPMLGD